MLRVVARGACRRFCPPGSGQFSGRRPRIWKTQHFSTGPTKPAPPGTESQVDFLIGRKYRLLKVISIVAAGFVSLVASDTCHLVWNLYHPDFPKFSKPLVHVDMSEAEDEILEEMNGEPQFVLLYGIPGCGKTTTVVSAARRRGKGVIYYHASSTGDSLQSFEDFIQKKYGAPLPRLREFLGWSSGRTIWNTLTYAGKFWTNWCCSAKDPARSLVIIFDGIQKLKKEDLYRLASLGKDAQDGSSFSVWLIASEERGLDLLFDVPDAITGINLPPVSEEKLVDMAKSALGGHPHAADLAERFVYLTGSSLAELWKLVKSAKTGKVGKLEGPIRHIVLSRSRPPVDNEEEKEFLKLVLASGEEGVASTKMSNWTCLQPDNGRVKLQSRYCRDLVSLWVATAEATAANAAATAADAAATAARTSHSKLLRAKELRTVQLGEAKEPRTVQLDTEIEDSKTRCEAAVAAQEAAQDKAKAAVATQDAAAALVSSNQLTITGAASRYLAAKE